MIVTKTTSFRYLPIFIGNILEDNIFWNKILGFIWKTIWGHILIRHLRWTLVVIIRFTVWVNTVTEQPYCSPTRNRHYRGCQDNQPWFKEPQIGFHLGLEALAMRLSRCCASQPIAGETEEKDDIIGKLGQTRWFFWLLFPPACEPEITFIPWKNDNLGIKKV